MKTVTYRLTNGMDKTIEYDETAPCWVCGLPVGSASMGGTVICPACDCGRKRDGGIYGPDSYCTECGTLATFASNSDGIIALPCGHASKLGHHHPHPWGPCDCLAESPHD